MNPLEIRNSKLGVQLVKALHSRKMSAYFVENKQDALHLALSLIPEDHIVS
jgi:hypothetical protein